MCKPASRMRRNQRSFHNLLTHKSWQRPGDTKPRPPYKAGAPEPPREPLPETPGRSKADGVFMNCGDGSSPFELYVLVIRWRAAGGTRDRFPITLSVLQRAYLYPVPFLSPIMITCGEGILEILVLVPACIPVRRHTINLLSN